jgi:hypothetical protein
MANALSAKHRIGCLQRSYEFSRLHEEWMACVYGLVVKPQRRGQRYQPKSEATRACCQAPRPVSRHQAGGKKE